MLDLRELVASLDDEDRRLWTLHRTEMRRSYMTAHNSVLGVCVWTEYDDQFLDIIDIKLALLFNKSGRMAAAKTIVASEDSVKMEAEIEKELSTLKTKMNGNGNGNGKPEPSEASKAMTEPLPLDGWGTGTGVAK